MSIDGETPQIKDIFTVVFPGSSEHNIVNTRDKNLNPYSISTPKHPGETMEAEEEYEH